MTRISATIKPIELCDQMLIAEHREIIRIPNTIKSGKAIVKNIPQDFRLGTGHVKFFYDKVLFLYNRYVDLNNECKNRGFNVTDYHECFEGLPSELMKDWRPNSNVRTLLKNRVNERLSSMKSIRYCSEKIELNNALIK